MGDEELDEAERHTEEGKRWAAFGEWLAGQRLSSGRNRTELAEMCGLSPSTLATLETGGRFWRGRWILPSPTDRTLHAIADALRLHPYEVFLHARGAVPEYVRREWEEVMSGSDREELPDEDKAAYERGDEELRRRSRDLDFNSKVARLSDEDREAVERIVDRLLGEQT